MFLAWRRERAAKLERLQKSIVLMTVFRSLYKDHVLSCNTTALADGRFGAQVAVIYTKGDKTTSQRFLDVAETFPEESEARDKALAVGMEWVDTEAKLEHGGLYPVRLLKRR